MPGMFKSCVPKVKRNFHRILIAIKFVEDSIYKFDASCDKNASHASRNCANRDRNSVSKTYGSCIHVGIDRFIFPFSFRKYQFWLASTAVTWNRSRVDKSERTKLDDYIGSDICANRPCYLKKIRRKKK